MAEKNPPEPAAEADRGELEANEPPNRPIVPAAERALVEAQARRAEMDRKSKQQPKELNGRRGPDPARYGDWEVKGIASDF